MPIHRPPRSARVLVVASAAALLVACGTGAAGPPRPSPPAVDPAGLAVPTDPVPDERGEAAADPTAGPHEISVVADFGPLPDGSGNAVVETIWTVDAHGTRRLVVDTPAGFAEQHVMTDGEHWWWLSPEVRETIADAEWVHFDLHAVELVGGRLPDIVTEARTVVPPPPDIVPGQLVAGREVLAAEVVGPHEVHLTVDGVEQPVVHRLRRLPADTTIELPVGAVDVRDLPEVLRW